MGMQYYACTIPCIPNLNMRENVFVQMGYSYRRVKRRNVLTILKDSLSEFEKKTRSNNDECTEKTRSGKEGTGEPKDLSAENEVRYKLIIDSSEDESVIRFLFTFGVLQREKTRIYVCSKFLGDGETQKVSLVSRNH